MTSDRDFPDGTVPDAEGSEDMPRSAFSGNAEDRGADGFRNVLQSWLADSRSSHRRNRKRGKHTRPRGENH